MPGLNEMIRKMVIAQLDDAREADGRMAELDAELKDIAVRMSVVIRNAPLLAAEQLAELSLARFPIETEIATLSRGKAMKPGEVDAVVDQIVANLQGAADELPKVGRVMLDKLIELLLDRVEVDLETRHATVSFSLSPVGCSMSRSDAASGDGLPADAPPRQHSPGCPC